MLPAPVIIKLQGQLKLADIGNSLCIPGFGAGAGYVRHDDGRQYSDDSHYHYEFDEGKSPDFKVFYGQVIVLLVGDFGFTFPRESMQKYFVLPVLGSGPDIAYAAVMSVADVVTL